MTNTLIVASVPSNVGTLFTKEMNGRPFMLQPHTLPGGREATRVTFYNVAETPRGIKVDPEDPAGESLIDEPFGIFTVKVRAFAERLNQRRPGTLSVETHGDLVYVYEWPAVAGRRSAVA